ncbi:MAG: proteobacterial dedicated sortase system histidine kinase [Gammaproteobacteria bacterium]|nr:proteobacterial dedicated sortase system histidine kinase [Gammaproteobacteria bacterium]
MGIRGKLLLASLSLLIIPWLGAQYIQNLESYLREAHEEKLIDRISIMAAVMGEQEKLLVDQNNNADIDNIPSHLYIRPLNRPIQLDGYLDDWRHYQDREQPLGKSNGDLSVLQRIGYYKDHLYITLQVTDDNVIYRSPNTQRLDRSDHIRISIIDHDGEFRRYQIAAITPGAVHAYLMPSPHKNGDNRPLRAETNISGAWQFSKGGYTVELQIPLTMFNGRLAIAVIDVDDANTRVIKNIVANANTERANELGTIVIPTPQMKSLLARLQRPQTRIWIVDNNRRVIGMAGDLHQITQEQSKQQNRNDASLFSILMKLFYHITLEQPYDGFSDPLSSASRLDNPAIIAALTGTAKTYWHSTENENISITIAAHPVYLNDVIVGAIAIEENSSSILIRQNKVIEAMVNMALLTFLLTFGVLLFFATRLSLRIHKLRNEVDASIADDGKIQRTQINSQSGDEIGDLGRSFSSMLKRLSQYNRYLETMSGKLSHELRTPITIVRSSLDNIDKTKLDNESLTYIKRADEGASRLNSILTRMSEATHLEQTIRDEAREHYSVIDLIEACINGYRLAYPQQSFDFICDESLRIKMVEGSPELLAQLMDKLVDNATDFSRSDTPITISCKATDDALSITVHNHGSTLPDNMRDSLFDSMVSVRQHKTGSPHLGLGLYIVRLITEFHHARIEVQNTNKPDGVAFILTIPVSHPHKVFSMVDRCIHPIPRHLLP